MIPGFTPFKVNSIENEIKNEISSYLKMHEPPIDHQIIRTIMNFSDGLDIDFNKIRILKSIDKNSDKITIVIPTQKINENLIQNLNQILAKFNYNLVEKIMLNSAKETHLYYSN